MHLARRGWQYATHVCKEKKEGYHTLHEGTRCGGHKPMHKVEKMPSYLHIVIDYLKWSSYFTLLCKEKNHFSSPELKD